MDEDTPVIALEALETLKEQRDTIKRLKGKLFASPDSFVHCKDCDNRECDGRAGTIVCGITGDSHSRLWFCADGERKE